MSLAKVNKLSAVIDGPPRGSVNVQRGEPVEGPGGRWIPCATEIAKGAFVSCLFSVGPGRRQVCATDRTMYSVDEALSHAVELAAIAAA